MTTQQQERKNQLKQISKRSELPTPWGEHSMWFLFEQKLRARNKPVRDRQAAFDALLKLFEHHSSNQFKRIEKNHCNIVPTLAQCFSYIPVFSVQNT